MHMALVGGRLNCDLSTMCAENCDVVRLMNKCLHLCRFDDIRDDEQW